MCVLGNVVEQYSSVAVQITIFCLPHFSSLNIRRRVDAYFIAGPRLSSFLSSPCIYALACEGDRGAKYRVEEGC